MADDKNYDDEELAMITLADSDGNPVEFEYLDSVEYEGAEYVVLLPMEDSEEGGELVILQVEEDEEDPDSENYNGVTDAAVLEAVFEIFKENHKDEFNFDE